MSQCVHQQKVPTKSRTPPEEETQFTICMLFILLHVHFVDMWSIRGFKTSFHFEQTRHLLRNIYCSLNFTGIQCITFSLFLKCYISECFMIPFQTARISKQSLVSIYKTTNKTSMNTQCAGAAAVTF